MISHVLCVDFGFGRFTPYILHTVIYYGYYIYQVQVLVSLSYVIWALAIRCIRRKKMCQALYTWYQDGVCVYAYCGIVDTRKSRDRKVYKLSEGCSLYRYSIKVDGLLNETRSAFDFHFYFNGACIVFGVCHSFALGLRSIPCTYTYVHI